MPDILSKPPFADVEPVTEVLHGIQVTDPYRWLEDQESPRTRDWLAAQSEFAREYLNSVPGRERIQQRIRDFLEVETYDSLLIHKGRYFFRKRLPCQEQPCIYTRGTVDGQERLLVDPSTMGGSEYTAVKPLAISPNGRILVYEVKEGGERSGRIELVDTDRGIRLPDVLPRGILRAFAFAPDSSSFYYAQDSAEQTAPIVPVIYQHRLGTQRHEDLVLDQHAPAVVRLGLVAGSEYLLILLYHFHHKTIDCYLQPFDSRKPRRQIATGIDYLFAPRIIEDRIYVLTSHNAPNLRIAELRLNADGTQEMLDFVPTRDSRILQWVTAGDTHVVSYFDGNTYRFLLFGSKGERVGEIPMSAEETAYLIGGDPYTGDILFQSESFFQPTSIVGYSLAQKKRFSWSRQCQGLDRSVYTCKRVWYSSRDRTRIPMFIVGRGEVLERQHNPVILTSYGGFRHVMTPQFSVFVSLLMEHGCVFALPSIRGGAEFGEEWYVAAKRHQRQKAFDDFLSAAEWLVNTGIAAKDRIGIFGGSNSGLLVGAAMTQAPSLFRAVLFNGPLLDMIRYHLFNGAIKWKEEFGTADDPVDFEALWSYSPYHRVRDNVAYPGVMIISGDSDQTCNPLHARKMVARLQAATSSSQPILLDYNPYRGHSPVLPLGTRIEALTDRIAFFCNQLGLSV